MKQQTISQLMQSAKNCRIYSVGQITFRVPQGKKMVYSTLAHCLMGAFLIAVLATCYNYIVTHPKHTINQAGTCTTQLGSAGVLDNQTDHSSDGYCTCSEGE